MESIASSGGRYRAGTRLLRMAAAFGAPVPSDQLGGLVEVVTQGTIVAFSDVNSANHYATAEAGVTLCDPRGKNEIAQFAPIEQRAIEMSARPPA